MKVRIELGEHRIVVEGRDPAGLLRATRMAAVERAPVLLRPAIMAMSDLAFATEIVRRSNAAHGRADPTPASAERFLHWAVSRGYAVQLNEV